ncbi:MAG: SusC/RagA family TonB-linked outer membrane protein [Bacteroidia bacterium]|nr:SusC/RagA family TonB-linked outer membrane protein [Bacteroidia bacterium]
MRKVALFLTCLLAMASVAFAQVSTVKGTIIFADDDSPVIGASVFAQGTQVGTVSDVNGNFTLTGIPSSATKLVVSCIGMETQIIDIAPVVNIVMFADAEALEEAVVTIAYGAAKKSSLTGAISSVSSEKLATRPASSVAQALEGTVTGVQVASTYGAPGTDPSFRIRGIGTVNGSSSPLYVIDGVPFGGNISDLNPADIESLTVLKDAASAALYGNRASNGVILITTKQAPAGRVSVTFDVKQGVYERGIPEFDLMNATEFMETEWMNLRNYRMGQGDSAADAAAYASNNVISDIVGLNIYNKADDQLFTSDGKLNAQILPGYTDDLDWFGQTIRKGHRQEYNVSASAANEKSDGYFSVGYLDEKGYLRNNDFNRLTGRASVNVRPVSYMKVGLNLSGTHQSSLNSSGIGDGSSSYVNPFMYCRQIAPVYPVHLHDINTGEYILDAAGNKQYDSGSYRDANGVVQTTRNQYADRHVIWENLLDSDETVRNTLDGIAYVDFYFLKDFTFTVKGDLNVRNSDNHTYNNATIGDGKGNSGRAKKVVYLYKNYTVQEQLRWTHQYGDHGLNALLGHENYYYNYDYTYGYKTTEVFPGKGNLTNFTSITDLDGYQTNYRTESYLGRVRYNYQDKYNVEASFRRDGSSRFHQNNRWGNFWSIGANWMISKEPWMQNVAWVNSLKLRADYGEVGNDAGAGYYGYMALYTANQNANKGAYYVSQNPNDELKWETGQSWGVGIESRLFNRLNFNIEYFDKRNKDLLFDVYLPLSAGGTDSGAAESTVTKNIGVISNRGVEIEADVDIFRSRDWNINFGANATMLKNKIVELPEQNKENGIVSGVHKIMEGHDRYAYWTYIWEGVDQLSGRSLYRFDDENYYITDNNKADGKLLYGSLKDKNGNANTLMEEANYIVINGVPYSYKTTYAKRDWRGSALPDVYGSFNFDVSYKNLSLTALFTYSLGGYTYDSVYSGLMSVLGTPSSIHRDVLNSWTAAPAGMTETSADRIDPNGIPQVNYNLSSDNNATSTRWLTSSSYLVFKNIALSYSLPKAWAKAMEMQGITVSATCENLFSLTARQGMTPQQSFSGGQSNYLVPARVFSAAVSFRF